MKRIMMVLPLAVLLAYCSGPRNTETSTDTDMNGTTSVTASTTGTNTSDMTTRSTDVSDVNTNTSTVSSSGTTTNNTTRNTSTQQVMDMNDPMVQHFEIVNQGSWTWDMNYPGYDRPTAGTYNSAINGNWQLVMTPELVSAWRQDNSRSLWSSGYAYDGRYLGGNTYLSASESFNTTNNNGSMNSSLNNSTSSSLNNNSSLGTNTQGSLQVNGSTSAGMVSSNNTSSSTSGLNNNASSNSSVANQMNGSTSNSSTSGITSNTTNNNSSTLNANSTGSSTMNHSSTTGTMSGNAGVSGSTSTSGTTGVSGSVNGSSSVNGTLGTSSTLNGSTGTNGSLSGSTDLNSSASTNMDVNSINYNAANGNMYQLPKFNLYLDNGSFTGYTGCNSISGRVHVTGSSLHFDNATPATNIDCLGGLDQNVFLDLLRRVDSYSYVGDELQLMQGNQVLLKFKKGNSVQ